MKTFKFIGLAGCLLLTGMVALADDSGPKVTLGTGVEVTSGTYGGDADIEDLYVPLSATLDYGNVAFRVTVPYLSVRAPEGTAITGPGGEPIPGTGDIVTNSGLGDVIGSVTVYDVVRSKRLGVALDLTGSVKLGTADEAKGLGTGETDFTVQADLLKFLDQATLLASVGYRFRGDPAGVDLEDSLLASVGGTYKFSPQVRGGLMFDYRESSISDRDSIREIYGFLSRRVNDEWKLQLFVLAGFTDSSPDWGAGIHVKRIM